MNDVIEFKPYLERKGREHLDMDFEEARQKFLRGELAQHLWFERCELSAKRTRGPLSENLHLRSITREIHAEKIGVPIMSTKISVFLLQIIIDHLNLITRHFHRTSHRIRRISDRIRQKQADAGLDAA